MRWILAATAAAAMVAGLGVAGAAPASAKQLVECGKLKVAKSVTLGDEVIPKGAYDFEAPDEATCRVAIRRLGLERVQGSYRLDAQGVQPKQTAYRYVLDDRRCLILPLDDDWTIVC